MDQAVYDAPNFAQTDTLSYWRRMRSPWISSKSVQQVSVTRIRGHKNKGRQLSKGGGVRWQPDPKVWNMDEGSFDQRESIVLPPPGRVRFPRLEIPPGAVLRTAPAILGRDGVRFSVSIRAAGEQKVIGTRTLQAGEHHGFGDWNIDLGEFAGKTVELELATEAVIPGISPFALWGAPRILAPGASDLPFNVVFIVVDAMRGDALSITHDRELDEKMTQAKAPPLDAWLPSLPEVAPNLDKLATEGALFATAFSAATWTRPGTIAMLTGAPSTSHGMPTLSLVPSLEQVRGFYTRRPPLLPLLLREHGATSHAIVNNFYIVGYAGVGVDMGFETLFDHRYEVEDTERIAADAKEYLERHRRERFFLFLNFDSPHVPYRPTQQIFAEIPGPPRGPVERLTRAYLAEIRKDDRAIGEVLAKLDELGLGEDTLVIVTADHGETLSVEHSAVPDGVDKGPAISGRFHHLSSLWDETARVPIILRYPKRIRPRSRISVPVSTIDIVPTVFDLAGFDLPKRIEGVSLLPFVSGEKGKERVILTEGRGAHALRVGDWRLVVRDKSYRRLKFAGKRGLVERQYELYDLKNDPGERVDVAARHPDIVKRLAALDPTKKPRSQASVGGKRVVHLRFSPGGSPHRLAGSLSSSDAVNFEIELVNLPGEHVKRGAKEISFSTRVGADQIVGFDVSVEPFGADLSWKLELDGVPFPTNQLHAGPYAIPAGHLAHGIVGAVGRDLIAGEGAPDLDAARDRGWFVFSDKGAREITFDSDQAKREAMDLMRAWGYVR
jgi:arylsulfatase A-like enzyme